MSNEIERKFFLKEMPDISGITKTTLERHFLFDEDGVELRIQSNGKDHTLQRKVTLSDSEHTVEKIALSQKEFDILKKLSVATISRESYHLSDAPPTDLRIYHGPFERLVRVEFEFENAPAMEAFRAPDWVGKEMTGSRLSRDSWLLKLSKEEFATLLSQQA
ncbi:MAG: hypothetical protein WCO52_03530 [bacterium]